MRSYLSALFLLLIPVFSNGQTCQGDIVLTSQAEVDAFECDSISGTLIINLTPLENLTYVGEHVILEGLDSLGNIYGLHNLSYVRCSFEIKNCDRLWFIPELISLSYVGRNFTLINNDSLQSLGPPLNIEYMQTLQVWGNPLLSDCTALCELLDNVEGEVFIRDNGGCLESFQYCEDTKPPVEPVVCNGDVYLVNQEDFDSFYCEIVNGDLIIGNHDNFDNNAGLDTRNLAMLKETTGDLFIIGDASNFTGLSNIERIGRSLVFVGGAYYDAEENYFSLDSLESLKEIGGDFRANYYTISGRLNVIEKPIRLVEIGYWPQILTPDFLGTTPSIQLLTVGQDYYEWDIKPSLEKLQNGGQFYGWWLKDGFDGMQHIDSLQDLEISFASPASFIGLENLNFVNQVTIGNTDLPADYCILYPLLSDESNYNSIYWEFNSLTFEEFLENCSEDPVVEVLTVFPNPVTSEFVSLEWNEPSGRATTVLITDNQGREVYQGIVDSDRGLNSMEVPVGNLKKGIYMIRIMNGEDVKRRRLLKN